MRKTTSLCLLAIIAAFMLPRVALCQEYDPPSQFVVKNLLKELDVIRIKIENLQKQEKTILKDLERAKAEWAKWKDQYIQVKMRGELQSSGQLDTYSSWVLLVHGRPWPLDLRHYKTDKKSGKKSMLTKGSSVVVYGRMIPLPDALPPGVGATRRTGDGFAILVEKMEAAPKPKKEKPKPKS